MGLLNFTDASGKQKSIRINEGEISIGCNPSNNVVLRDDMVSDVHACVYRDGDGNYSIIDLESENGIFVNGKQVLQSVLHHGDQIKIGDSRINFSLSDRSPFTKNPSLETAKIPKKVSIKVSNNDKYEDCDNNGILAKFLPKFNSKDKPNSTDNYENQDLQYSKKELKLSEHMLPKEHSSNSKYKNIKIKNNELRKFKKTNNTESKNKENNPNKTTEHPNPPTEKNKHNLPFPNSSEKSNTGFKLENILKSDSRFNDANQRKNHPHAEDIKPLKFTGKNREDAQEKLSQNQQNHDQNEENFDQHTTTNTQHNKPNLDEIQAEFHNEFQESDLNPFTNNKNQNHKNFNSMQDFENLAQSQSYDQNNFETEEEDFAEEEDFTTNYRATAETGTSLIKYLEGIEAQFTHLAQNIFEKKKELAQLESKMAKTKLKHEIVKQKVHEFKKIQSNLDNLNKIKANLIEEVVSVSGNNAKINRNNPAQHNTENQEDKFEIDQVIENTEKLFFLESKLNYLNIYLSILGNKYQHATNPENSNSILKKLSDTRDKIYHYRQYSKKFLAENKCDRNELTRLRNRCKSEQRKTLINLGIQDFENNSEPHIVSAKIQFLKNFIEEYQSSLGLTDFFIMNSENFSTPQNFQKNHQEKQTATEYPKDTTSQSNGDNYEKNEYDEHEYGEDSEYDETRQEYEDETHQPELLTDLNQTSKVTFLNAEILNNSEKSPIGIELSESLNKSSHAKNKNNKNPIKTKNEDKKLKNILLGMMTS